MKLVISDPRTGRAIQKEIGEEESKVLVGKKIGDVVDLSPIGLKYKVQITGGTDRDGFPMRPDVHGAVRKKILIRTPPGNREGVPRRKTVRGNVITPEIEQVNVKIIEGEKIEAGDEGEEEKKE